MTLVKINDTEIFYARYDYISDSWSNVTVISDGFNGIWGWNDGDSEDPDVCVDLIGNVHVVWDDHTDNPAKWGIDKEIMYATFSVTSNQWSNATVISDGYDDVWDWNNETSGDPSIAVDLLGNVHVVWDENTDGIWGTAKQVMYANYSVLTAEWSNGTVISDGYNGVWGWNDGGASDLCCPNKYPSF